MWPISYTHFPSVAAQPETGTTHQIEKTLWLFHDVWHFAVRSNRLAVN